MNSKETKRIKGLLMVGGASRNVGKTTLVSQIIGHFAGSYQIVGLKIKTIYDGDQNFHGSKDILPDNNFVLTEEFSNANEKDSSAMLKAGAKRAFRLKVHHSKLLEAFEYFLKNIGENSLIICESNSLRRVFIPDIFLLIRHNSKNNMKPSALELEKYADKIIYTDGSRHLFELSSIKITNSEWVLNN